MKTMALEKWLFPFFFASFVSIILVLSAISGLTASFTLYAHQPPSPATDIRRGPLHPPSFAYYITGGRGDGRRMVRLLLAVYHPRNRYLLHLSSEAGKDERDALASTARSAVPAIRSFGNVDVVGRPDANTYMGSSGLAATLHAAAVMLKMEGGWDWFVTLTAADYPLITQDDMIHVFSSAPRDLNFIDHTSDLGWKEIHRVQPIIVDPGIYLARRVQIFTASEKRGTPDAFKFFTGSPWVILSRSFIEYCVLGWDNLPRILLLYFTNVQLAQESYFHSVLCNSEVFQNTTVNSDLRYMSWDNPPRMEPQFLNITNYDQMLDSGVPFARQFHEDDLVLDHIDDKILWRRRHRAVPGAWCSGKRRWWVDQCSKWNTVNMVEPGPRAERFGELMNRLLTEWRSQVNSCK